jgi:hypothetical protein
MMAVLRAGAAGYPRKDADSELLLKAIRALAAGRCDGSAARGVYPGAMWKCCEVAFGRTNREMGERLFIAEGDGENACGTVAGGAGITEPDAVGDVRGEKGGGGGEGVVGPC